MLSPDWLSSVSQPFLIFTQRAHYYNQLEVPKSMSSSNLVDLTDGPTRLKGKQRERPPTPVAKPIAIKKPRTDADGFVDGIYDPELARAMSARSPSPEPEAEVVHMALVTTRAKIVPHGATAMVEHAPGTAPFPSCVLRSNTPIIFYDAGLSGEYDISTVTELVNECNMDYNQLGSRLEMADAGYPTIPALLRFALGNIMPPVVCIHERAWQASCDGGSEHRIREMVGHVYVFSY